MTFENWKFHAAIYWSQNTVQREGQAYFNSLCEFRPDISEKIRCTPNDPFYNNDNLEGFFRKVEELWN
jgi:hypothetical protein